MQQAYLRLFVTATTARSLAAVRCLNELAPMLPDGYLRTEIVNVLDDPCRAEADRVIATPTLIRLFPLPAVRLVGDFESPERLMKLLDLLQTPHRIC
ncbi:MAG: circadian clock KaiB family protein [Bryobacteraceae bacterium]|nr:circadian clock KaiB family protein [Bryobacteraceae bacterium]